MKYGPHSSETRSLSPFFVGLLGHRALREEELPKIQEEFDYQIKLLLERLKFTKIIVLTSLAPGADRIAQNSKHRDHFSVCAVLPFNQKEYVKDYPSKPQSDEFKKSLADCDYVIVYPGAIDRKKYLGRTREKGYRECARWVSDNSNLLIVVWDGKKTGKVGGTGDTIEYRLEDIASKPLIYSRGSGLIHIKASNGSTSFNEDCDCVGHLGENATYLNYISELESLNSRISPTRSTINDDQLKVYFNQFDQSAVILQKEFRNKTILLLALGVITLTFASFQQITFDLSWLLATGGALAFTLLLWWRLTQRRTKAAYETFRFVAEVLRIQIWWNEVGINRNILHEDIESHDINDVVYLMMSNILMFSTIHNLDLHRIKHRKRKSRNETKQIEWVEEQIRYLDGVAGQEGAIKRTLRSAKRNLRFSVGALSIAGVIQIVSTVIHMQYPVDGLPISESLLKILFSFSLAIAAAFAALEEALGNKEIAVMYELKSKRLAVAALQLRKVNPNQDKRTLVTHVGIDSLAESLRWFQLKSEREVKPFQAS